jgi:hypothetical protein
VIAAEDKLPWFQAVCVVLPQLPYLMNECRRHPYKRQRNLLGGFCYAASEAIYHLSEDPLEPWWLRYGPRQHQTHWFLKHAKTGEVIDVTASQFGDMDAYAMYDFARRRAFGSKEPSKRAQYILDRISDAYFRKGFDVIPFERAENRYHEAQQR